MSDEATPTTATPEHPARVPGRVLLRRAVWLGLAASVLAVATEVVVLERGVRARFAAGAARIHTRFFSDRLRLEPGMDIDRIALAERLRRLGYRQDPKLAEPATWWRRGDVLAIRARAFTDPDGALPERSARLRLAGAKIAAIEDVATGAAQRHLTLEPAWLGVTWNGRWELRRPVALATLPPHVADAVLAAEDFRFRRHHGIDVVGIGRALVRNLRAHAVLEGGSTITQQLARSIFLSTARTWRRKLEEVVLALLLELHLSKDEILELYLNEVYLGRHGGLNVVGFGQAARTFFGKDAATLTLGEAATIAGLIRAPNTASPLRSPARALRRRDGVLDRMVARHMLRPDAAAAAKRTRLEQNDAPPPTTLAGAFLLEAARRELERVVGPARLHDDGLDVYTTMDPAVQAHAERGVASALASLERTHRWLRGRKTPLEAAFVVVDLADGGVRALVGGRDFPRRPFDRAVTARRQAGSTFKPLVFLTAFERDAAFASTSLLEDRPLTVRTGGDVWEPLNYDQRFRGSVTARTAVERSLNVPTVRLAMSVGIDAVARTATDAGWVGTLPPVPAVALGAADTTLLDLAGVYTAFPRLGARLAPRLVRGALDRNGATVHHHDRPAIAARDPQAAYLVHHLLEGVVDRGTARRLRAAGFTGPLAGKTGTTNDFRDAWFVGYSPDLLGAAWVGFDDGRPVKLAASATALEVWSAAMRPVLAARRTGRFPVPTGITFADVDPASGRLATEVCPGIREAFRAGTEPRTSCGERRRRTVADDGDEPLRAPARIIEGWVHEMMRAFGATRRRAR